MPGRVLILRFGPDAASLGDCFHPQVLSGRPVSVRTEQSGRPRGNLLEEWSIRKLPNRACLLT